MPSLSPWRYICAYDPPPLLVERKQTAAEPLALEFTVPPNHDPIAFAHSLLKRLTIAVLIFPQIDRSNPRLLKRRGPHT